MRITLTLPRYLGRIEETELQGFRSVEESYLKELAASFVKRQVETGGMGDIDSFNVHVTVKTPHSFEEHDFVVQVSTRLHYEIQ